jgi:hypothetical protein
VSFTQPIIPAGGTIDDLDWRPVLEPEPKDGGDWRVISDHTLAYQPHKAWTHSTEYTITVLVLFTCGVRACGMLRWSANREPIRLSGCAPLQIPVEAKSLLEDPLEKQFSYSFTSSLINVLHQYPSAGAHSPASRQPVILVVFDQEIEPEVHSPLRSARAQSSWIG